MPIYSYRCDSCGRQQDILRKMSDPPLTVCPACGAPALQKQVTAAGFQLKGSGWYVTDFRDGKGAKKSDAAPAADTGDGGSAAPAPSETAAAKPAESPPAKTEAAPVKSSAPPPSGTT